MIRRLQEETLREYLKQFPAVGIIGPRQVGKTTLAKLISDNNTVYLDLESDVGLSKLTDPGFFLRANADKTIILDEVQNLPELFPLLRAIIDEDNRPGRFVLLGSAAPSLIRNSSESLAGRIGYFELTSFLLKEVDNQEDLWLKGGFPKSYLDDTKKSMVWRNQFLDTYIQRDLPNLGLNASPRLLSNFLRMLAHSTGNLWNASAFSRSLGITSPTAKSYLEFLEGAFLIDVLEPYHTNVKKRITKSPKTYFKDTGVLHSLLKLSSLDDLHGHPVIGNSWENFVIQQIKGHLRDRYEYFFYRTQDGSEMDLILAEGNIPKYALEIKLTSAPKTSKGLLNAVQDIHASFNYIITTGTDRYPIHESVEVIGLAEFIEIAGR